MFPMKAFSCFGGMIDSTGKSKKAVSLLLASRVTSMCKSRPPPVKTKALIREKISLNSSSEAS